MLQIFVSICGGKVRKTTDYNKEKNAKSLKF